MTTFPQESRAIFARHYPETPHRLMHLLAGHPLLELGALADLAARAAPASIESNAAAQPLGVTGKPPPPPVSPSEAIRDIARSDSWTVIKNIEQDAAYAALLGELLAELQGPITAHTGEMIRPEGFIFVTSPHGVTPYHFDPEHNILLQLRGTKTMIQFPAGDPRFAPDEKHEAYHTGGPRELDWQDAWLEHGQAFTIGPGEALFVPVMAPHFVRNGPEPSVSLSITWRSAWSMAEADARAFNAALRCRGMSPSRTGRYPATNRAKALAWRAMRKLGLTH
jgi:hypothetical protein